MRFFFRLPGYRAVSAVIAVMLAIPLFRNGLTGFYAWLSPFIMLNSVFMLKSMVLLNWVGFGVIIFLFFRKRWFCRYVCPVGWACDTVSSYSRRKNFSLRKFPPLGEWMAMISLSGALLGVPVFIWLDPMAIFHSFFTGFSTNFRWVSLILLSGLLLLILLHLVFPGLWCSRLCPLGGLQNIVESIKNRVLGLFRTETAGAMPALPERRLFLASGIGLVSGWVIPRFLSADNPSFIRPPAATGEDIFNLLCIRCGNCIRSCPTQIIRPHNSSGSLISLMTPEINYENGYCLEKCNLCSRVCPSGAITLFHPDAKKDLKMGLAKVHLQDCLLTQFTECDRCKANCQYEAMDIVPSIDYPLIMNPVVNGDTCVGCGACAAVCPTRTIEILALNNMPGS